MKKLFIYTIAFALPLTSFGASFTKEERLIIGLSVSALTYQIIQKSDLPAELVDGLLVNIEGISDTVTRVDKNELSAAIAIENISSYISGMAFLLDREGYGDRFANLSNKERDSIIKSNMSSLRAQAELVYDQNGNQGFYGLCGGMDIGHIISGIRDVFPENTEFFNCIDSNNFYRAYVPLIAESGKVVCVDSSGRMNSNLTEKEILKYPYTCGK